MSRRTAHSTAPHPHSHPMHHNTVIPEQAFSLQGCCTLPGHLRAKAPPSPTPKSHYFTKYLNHLPPVFTEQVCLFTSLLPDQGTEGELWLKYKMLPFHEPQDEWKGKCVHNPLHRPSPTQPSQALQGALQCSVSQPVGTPGPHKPLTRLKSSHLRRPQGRVRSSEQVPAPALPLLAQHHKQYLLHSWSGPGLLFLRATRLRQHSLTGADSSKQGSHQWHSGHGHNSWSDFHTCFCPEKKVPSAPFFCTNMVKVKEE